MHAHITQWLHDHDFYSRDPLWIDQSTGTAICLEDILEQFARTFKVDIVRKDMTLKELHSDMVSEIIASCKSENGKVVYDPGQDSSFMYLKNYVKLIIK